MPQQKENGLILEDKNGMIYLVLKLTLKRRILWTLLILLTLVLIALGSSLNEDTRRIILDFLIGAMQITLFKEQRQQT